MAALTLKDLQTLLDHAPTYQAALKGQWTSPGMPNTPGFKSEQLRAAAKQDGIDLGGANVGGGEVSAVVIDPKSGKISTADNGVPLGLKLAPWIIAGIATLGRD